MFENEATLNLEKRERDEFVQQEEGRQLRECRWRQQHLAAGTKKNSQTVSVSSSVELLGPR